MPTYGYLCTDCGVQFEAVHSIHDDALTTCVSCGGAARRTFGGVSVAFRGAGFYRTDSRASANTESRATTSPSSTSGSKES